MVNKDLGMVTAYAYAVSKGYTGTEEEFAELMASYAEVGESAAESARAAAASETAAKAAETGAKASEVAAKQAELDASTAQTAAAGYADSASQSAQGASNDATAAAQSKTAAAASETNAAGSATAAAASETAAKASETAAKTAATNAGNSETAAKASEEAAAASAEAAAESARTLVLDPTLTQPNQAAEAKATGEAVTDLKKAIRQSTDDAIDGVFIVPGDYIEQGVFTLDGVPINNPVNQTRVRTKYPVYVKSGSTFSFTAGSACQLIYWFFFKDSGELETSGNWIGGALSKTFAEGGYLLFALRRSNSTDLSPSDYDADVVVKTSIANANVIPTINNVDSEINLLHNLINYDYDTPYDLPPDATSTTARTVGFKREKNTFTINTANATSVAVRIKISGNVMRTYAFETIDEWVGIALTSGHTYRIRSIPVSGSSNIETPNAVAVYLPNTHFSIGTFWVEKGVYIREFTAGNDPVTLAYYIPAGATYTNYKCLVVLEDMSVEASKTDNIVDEYDAEISTGSQGANSGTKLKVVSYNVAKYNNDTDVYLPTAKEINFKKMLCEITPDILAIQEDKQYIDSSSTRSALTSLYNPIFPYEYLETSGLQCTIRSKVPAATHDLLKYSNGRWVEIATYVINGKTLLFGSTHPVANYDNTGLDSAESIAARLVQYQELVNWLNGTGTLLRYNSGSAVYCPSYDWCVMCGDYNTITDDDKTNFKTTVETGGFKIANGDWLGWVETNYKFRGQPMCLDNVIVSDNVIFDSIISHSAMLDRLYSDHVPFEVTVTLLDT